MVFHENVEIVQNNWTADDPRQKCPVKDVFSVSPWVIKNPIAMKADDIKSIIQTYKAKSF